MLFPQENIIREIKDLSGIWKFKIDKKNEGLKMKWFKKPMEDFIFMPVPASYNEITQDIEIRDHIGNVWYEKEFFIPNSWKNSNIILRIDGAANNSIIFINGRKVGEHKGAFLPKDFEISDFVNFENSNRITICINNILDWTTLPPGEIKKYNDDGHPKDFIIQEYYHDFYNYSGIHRKVLIYKIPKTYIEDVLVRTDIKGRNGIISYNITVNGNEFNKVEVKIIDKDRVLKISNKLNDKIIIKDANFWFPGKPYLYDLSIELFMDKKLIDCYKLPIGIRTIKVTDKQFLINGKPFYFKGFGKHEDSEIRGKGYDEVIVIKDFNLLKWIGANSFRTSHYPYAEEILYLADREGIVIIDEVPAVGLNMWNKKEKIFTKRRAGKKLLNHHIQVINDLIKRDKNHPSVVMWSLANEAATYEKGAINYFKKIAEVTRKLDPTRPITIVNSSNPDECKVAQFFDVICFNRYYSWYSDPGHLELIEIQLSRDLLKWYKRFKKPVFLTEFGADTIAGFHYHPPVMFSEEYQIELLKEYFKVLDKFDFVIGEHIWNFADFATKQGLTRVGGNKKGIFTRNRQPKSAAFYIKERWNKLNKFC